MKIQRVKRLSSLIFGRKKHQRRLKLLKECYSALPPDVKTLTDFNTRLMLYDESSTWGLLLARTEEVRLAKPKIRVFSSIFDDRTYWGACKIFYRSLVHELSHTLDPYFLACNPAAKPLFKDDKNIFSRWHNILEQEPNSTDLPEKINEGCESIYLWAMHPREQWACRFALTIMVDYLVPAGLVPESDLCYRRELDENEFKNGWPLSYKFFQDYTQLILKLAEQKK